MVVIFGAYGDNSLFGVEMHSQVMAVGSGVPGVLLRHPMFGSKSEMWKTIEVPEWLIHTEYPDYAAKAVAAVRNILADSEGTSAKLRRARQIIDQANCDAIERSFFRCSQ